MLVLSRKYRQSIIITNKQTGEEIKIMAVRGTAQSCNIGIEADPNSYTIKREELHVRKDD